MNAQVQSGLANRPEKVGERLEGLVKTSQIKLLIQYKRLGNLGNMATPC